MMTAIASNDSVVEAWHVKRGEDVWRCPECHGLVILKRGRVVTPHFAHSAKTDCMAGKGESELHRKCKRELYEAMTGDPRVTKLQLERELGEVRPDVSAYINGSPVALEVQVSNLSIDEIARRTTIYYRKKVAVLWLSMWRDALIEDRISLRPWEKWLHAAQFGRVYYWLPGLGANVTPFSFDPFYIDVPATDWGGGYQRISKRWKTPVSRPSLNLIDNFTSTVRHPWSGGSIDVPRCRLYLEKKAAK